jgi:hypothetical protein
MNQRELSFYNSVKGFTLFSNKGSETKGVTVLKHPNGHVSRRDSTLAYMAHFITSPGDIHLQTEGKYFLNQFDDGGKF